MTTKILLNSTRNTRDRYYLINGNMGNYGDPANHANHKYLIANGIDKGNGYQGYMAVSHFLTLDYVPAEAKQKVIAICKEQGLIYNK